VGVSFRRQRDYKGRADEDRFDYSIGGLENLDLVTRPYTDGLAFSKYWANVKQSHVFKREDEVLCTA